MARTAALAGFLIVQAIVLVLWVTAVMPFLQAGAPLVPDAGQIWSGGGYSDLSSNFRTGSNVVLTPAFDPRGAFLWAALLMIVAGGAAVAASLILRRGRTWIAVGVAVAALAAGAGANFLIASQWQGDTSFPAGYLDVSLLYAMSKAFNMQFYIGFALFALSVVALIAGFASKEKPLGFHVVALNWVVVAAVWLVAYVAFYLAPFPNLFGGEA